MTSTPTASSNERGLRDPIGFGRDRNRRNIAAFTQ
jgi:hypothetical protein